MGKTENKIDNITWCMILGNKHTFFALMICFVGTFNITFFQTFLSTELTDLGFDEDNVGYVLGV